MMATAYLIILAGIAIIVAAWHSNWTTRRADAAYLKSIKPITDRMIPFDEAEKLARGCPDPGRYNADESARREALMARAPSRERINRLMDRLPPCDEWLDDRYDQ